MGKRPTQVTTKPDTAVRVSIIFVLAVGFVSLGLAAVSFVIQLFK